MKWVEWILSVFNFFKRKKQVDVGLQNYLNKPNEYFSVATTADILALGEMGLERLKRAYMDQRSKSLDLGIYFDSNNTPYVIIGGIRYDVDTRIDSMGTLLAEKILPYQTVVVKPWRQVIQNPDAMLVIGLRENNSDCSFIRRFVYPQRASD